VGINIRQSVIPDVLISNGVDVISFVSTVSRSQSLNLMVLK